MLDKRQALEIITNNIDGVRYYTINDRQYPSVTSVLNCKPNRSLEKWRKDVGEDVADYIAKTSADRGTKTHALIESYIKGERGQVLDLLPNALFKVMQPYIDDIDNVVCLEEALWSDKLKIAGRVDCIAEFNGILSVIDFKTSRGSSETPRNSHMIQATAYAEMYGEMYDEEINQLVIIKGCEDGGVQIFVRDKKKYIRMLQEHINYFYNTTGEKHERNNE
jgi:genome maintenance exonuclease 1